MKKLGVRMFRIDQSGIGMGKIKLVDSQTEEEIGGVISISLSYPANGPVIATVDFLIDDLSTSIDPTEG